MTSSKRNLVQTIIIAVLAILLAASLTLNITGAWFQDYDSTKTTVTIGDPAEIRIANGKGQAGGDFVVGEEGKDTILPGDKLLGDVKLVSTTKISSEVVRAKFDLLIYEPITSDGNNVQYENKGVSLAAYIAEVNTRLENDYGAVNGMTIEDDGLSDDEKTLIRLRDKDLELKQSLTALKNLWIGAFSTDWKGGINKKDQVFNDSEWYYYQKVVNYEDVSNGASLQLFNEIYFGVKTGEMDEDRPVIDASMFGNAMGYYKFEILIEVEAMQAANFKDISSWVTDIPNGTLRDELGLGII